MTQTPLQQIQGLYHRLSSADRRKLVVFIGAFKGMGGATGELAQQFNGEDWLLAGIHAEMNARGFKRSGRKLDIPRIAPNYAEDAALVRSELLRLLKKHLPRPKHAELLALGRRAAHALAEYRSPVTPLGLNWMLRNAGKTLEAIDASFPGYMAAGLVNHLVRNEIKQVR